MSQITAFDSAAENYVTAVGDSANNALRVNQVAAGLTNVQLLPSAARTTQTTTATQTNAGHRGIILYMNVTAASGTGGLTPSLLFVDSLSGATVQATLGTAKTATGCFAYTIYPASGLAANNGAAVASPLPSQWQIKIGVGDSSSYTYSLSADLLP